MREGLRRLSFAALAAVLTIPALAARASVTFEPWQDTSFRHAVAAAAAARKPVVLVVTQPDWCPPCIKLDARWLRNPADAEVAALTRDAVVLEVHGYDAPGAALLREEGVSFQGTPTIHVFAPESGGRRLGDARLLGSIVGAPEDLPARLAAIMRGDDALPALRRAVTGAVDPVARGTALMEFGAALAARGDAPGAEAAYRGVRRIREKGMGAPARAQLAELRRKAAWEDAATLGLRVRKRYATALRDIEAWHAGYRVRPAEASAYSYARSWALAHLGRMDEALGELRAGLPRTADGDETFLYFCFRSDDPRAWTAGERRAADALKRHPEERAALLEGLGRIQRRQGRLSAAQASFAEAVRLASDADARMTYQGQLETVERERREGGDAPART